MSRKTRLDGIRTTVARATAQQIADGDSKSLARFHIVVAREFRIRQYENARPRRRFVDFLQIHRWARHQSAELHFQDSKPRRKAWITVATFYTWATWVANRLHRKLRHGATVRCPRRSPFGGFGGRSSRYSASR